MAITRQDFAVLLLYHIGYTKFRKWVYRLRGRPVTRFVTFHDVPEEWEKNFRARLSFLKQYTNVVSLDDYFAGRLSRKKVNVVLTFDDGYKSWITGAMPALRELEMPATFFISSGFIDLSKEKADEFIRFRLRTNRKITGGLTAQDVRRMANEGFTVGGHTCQHSNLAEVHSRDDLLCDILTDKRKLEEIIGREIHYFAYPFGACRNPNLDLIGVLKEAGYRGALTTIPGFNGDSTNCYLLHRDLIAVPTSIAALKARVLGTYDAVSSVKRLVAFVSRL